MKINLSIKMFLFNAIVLGVLFTGTGFYYLNMYGQNLNDNLLDKSRLLIKMYKSIIIQDIVNYNDIALLYHIEKIESIDDINYAVIVDSHSTILAHSDVYEIGKTYNDPLTEWTTNVKNFSFRLLKQGKEELIVCAAPLDDPEFGIVGFLRIGMSKSTILKKIDTMKKHFMLFAVGFTGIYIFLFLIYLFFQVIHPLILVRDGVKFMHKNLTKFKFKLKSNDEINEIYDNVNFLVDKINEDLSTQDKFKDNMLAFNDLRLEEILNVLYKDSCFVLADKDNKVVFSNIPETMQESVIGQHVMDAFKDTDVVDLLAQAYTNKNNIFEGEFDIFNANYRVVVFVLKGNENVDDRAVVVFQKK